MIRDFINKIKLNKIRKKISKLQKEAMLCQRNGNLRQYASINKEISELEKNLKILKWHLLKKECIQHILLLRLTILKMSKAALSYIEMAPTLCIKKIPGATFTS